MTPTAQHNPIRRRPQGRAFTLVEVLMAMLIVLVIIGIAATVFTGALRGAEETATRERMKSMAMAIEQFRNDFGYLPPLIDDDPSQRLGENAFTVLESQTDAAIALRRERYHSVFSLPVYLVGVGAISPETVGENSDRARHDGAAGPGLRDPGPDRAWGGAAQRNDDTHRVRTTGRVFGPYLDVSSGDALRNAATTAAFNFPEDAGVAEGERAAIAGMSVIVDYWDVPIRYYRFWPTRDAATDQRSLDGVPVELVAPGTLEAAGESDEIAPTADPGLFSAEYALLSAGSDGAFSGAAETFSARQGESPEGFVEEFLELDGQARRLVIEDGIRDNLRLLP